MKLGNVDEVVGVERHRQHRRHLRSIALPPPQSVCAFRSDRARQLCERHFRADFGILSPIRPVTIDVAVSNPAAASYIKPPEAYVLPASSAADPIGRNFAFVHREIDGFTCMGAVAPNHL